MKKILVWKEPSKDVEQNKLAQTAMHSELVQQSQEKLMRSSTDVYISRYIKVSTLAIFSPFGPVNPVFRHAVFTKL